MAHGEAVVGVQDGEELRIENGELKIPGLLETKRVKLIHVVTLINDFSPVMYYFLKMVLVLYFSPFYVRKKALNHLTDNERLVLIEKYYPESNIKESKPKRRQYTLIKRRFGGK